MEIQDSWLYQRHVRAEEILGVKAVIARNQRRGIIALVSTVILFALGFYFERAGWQPAMFTALSLGAIAIISATLFLGETGKKLLRQRKFEREIERDIVALDEIITSPNELLEELSADLIRSRAIVELIADRGELRSFRENIHRVKAVIEQKLPPAFSGVCVEAIGEKLENLEQKVEAFKSLLAKFSLTEDPGTGKLEWKSSD